MSLADRVKHPPVEQPRRTRSTHPKGWEPGIRWDGVLQSITTDVLPTLEGEPDWRGALNDMGIEVPNGYRVRISEMRYDPVAWTRDSPDQKYATTAPAWRYRFVIEPDSSVDTIDGVEILNRLKRAPKPRKKLTGDSTFVLNLNDTQMGKSAGGGTEATLERLDRYFDLAAARAKEVGSSDLVILLGGDLVEGCSIFPNQSFEIDSDRRTQIENTTAVLLDMLDRLAPLFETVRVLAVPGNHGEHRINGKRVNRHDNDDQLVAQAAATAAQRDPALQHVTFIIAQDEPALTIDIQGHILALTHGSVYGKMTGATPAAKAYSWFKNMAAGRHPVGDADILVGNHFHHQIIVDYGTLLFVQNPAMDGGSPFFTDYAGTEAESGMASWVMTRESRMKGYEVLR